MIVYTGVPFMWSLQPDRETDRQTDRRIHASGSPERCRSDGELNQPAHPIPWPAILFFLLHKPHLFVTIPTSLIPYLPSSFPSSIHPLPPPFVAPYLTFIPPFPLHHHMEEKDHICRSRTQRATLEFRNPYQNPPPTTKPPSHTP